MLSLNESESSNCEKHRMKTSKHSLKDPHHVLVFRALDVQRQLWPSRRTGSKHPVGRDAEFLVLYIESRLTEMDLLINIDTVSFLKFARWFEWDKCRVGLTHEECDQKALVNSSVREHEVRPASTTFVDVIETFSFG